MIQSGVPIQRILYLESREMMLFTPMVEMTLSKAEREMIPFTAATAMIHTSSISETEQM